jgi:hypothetical protein
VTRHFFWSGRTTWRRIVYDWRQRVKRQLVRSRAARRQRLTGARGKRNGWWPALVMSRHRDKEASPRGTVVTGGVRSLSHYHAWCHARVLATGVSRLSGCCS